METEKNILKVGDNVYIDTWLFVSHGEDDFIGGLCEISSVKVKYEDIWITIKEDEGFFFNWKSLSKIRMN